MKQLFVIYSLLALLSCNSPNTNKEIAQEIDYDSINAVLEEVYFADQIVRGNNQHNITSHIVVKLEYNIEKVDQFNQQIFLGIVEEIGWPHDSLLTWQAREAMFLVLQHAPSEMMEKYFPLFKEKYGLTAQTAMMEDRILMRQGKKQIYGTQASSSLREDGSMAIWPIEDPKNINQLRQNLFSTTIEEYAEMLGAEYDPDEELP